MSLNDEHKDRSGGAVQSADTENPKAGVIYVIGIGAGGSESMTLQARKAIDECEIIVGYSKYVELISDILTQKGTFTTGMTHEVDRCTMALKLARDYGKNVAVVSSGDSGVYGMAGLMLEIASGSGIEVRVIPGVTAANSCAAILGAPLMNDYVTVSLSDRLTDRGIIEKRLMAACLGDFVVCIYNPASTQRPNHLRKACDILLTSRKPETPSGFVRNAGREGEYSEVMTLRKLRNYKGIDMSCTVIVGNSQSYILDGKIITPRGYKLGDRV